MKVPKKVTERFQKEVRSFQRVLTNAKDRDINEADTVTIVTDILSSVFGFDKYTEVTGEFAIRGTFCDLAVKIKDNIKYLIEVKAIGLDLKDNHLRQVVNYGANHGIPWVVLTNGLRWELYRIRFEKPIDCDLVFALNFSELNPRRTRDQEELFALCKEGMSKAAIETMHARTQSLNRFVVAAVVLSESSLNLIRREVRKAAPGVKVDTDEIKAILVGDVLKREVIEGDDSKKAVAKLAKAMSRPTKKRQPISKMSATDPSPNGSDETDQ